MLNTCAHEHPSISEGILGQGRYLRAHGEVEECPDAKEFQMPG